MANLPPQIFLDANVVIDAGKPPGDPIFERVVDLVKAGFVKVLTTDLTKIEVAKKHIANDLDVLQHIAKPHYRRIAKAALGIDLPDIKKADIRNALIEKYTTEVEEMFSSLNAETLSIDSVKPSVVFDAYSKGEGFFTGEGKKDQFPDAFIFECLKTKATEKSPVIIVSKDGDYESPSKQETNISVLKSIPDLFHHLSLEIEAPNVLPFLEDNENTLLELVTSELNDWILQATDVEDADIDEPEATEIQINDIISFGKIPAGNEILVIGQMEIKASVSYSHPNWDTAMYDGEDKTLYPFEEVSGTSEITIVAEFSTSILVDKNNEPQKIDHFGFRNDNFIWVELHPYDPYQ